MGNPNRKKKNGAPSTTAASAGDPAAAAAAVSADALLQSSSPQQPAPEIGAGSLLPHDDAAEKQSPQQPTKEQRREQARKDKEEKKSKRAENKARKKAREPKTTKTAEQEVKKADSITVESGGMDASASDTVSLGAEQQHAAPSMLASDNAPTNVLSSPADAEYQNALESPGALLQSQSPQPLHPQGQLVPSAPMATTVYQPLDNGSSEQFGISVSNTQANAATSHDHGSAETIVSLRKEKEALQMTVQEMKRHKEARDMVMEQLAKELGELQAQGLPQQQDNGDLHDGTIEVEFFDPGPLPFAVRTKTSMQTRTKHAVIDRLGPAGQDLGLCRGLVLTEIVYPVDGLSDQQINDVLTQVEVRPVRCRFVNRERQRAIQNIRQHATISTSHMHLPQQLLNRFSDSSPSLIRGEAMSTSTPEDEISHMRAEIAQKDSQISIQGIQYHELLKAYDEQHGAIAAAENENWELRCRLEQLANQYDELQASKSELEVRWREEIAAHETTTVKLAATEQNLQDAFDQLGKQQAADTLYRSTSSDGLRLSIAMNAHASKAGLAQHSGRDQPGRTITRRV